MKFHPLSLGWNKLPLPDHSSQIRGTDPKQSTSPGSLPCRSLPRTCRSACRHCRRCTKFHPPSPGWSKRPLPDHSFPRRGTDPTRSTSPGSLPCTSPKGTCRSACTRSHRCRMFHPLSLGWSKRPLPGCRSPHRGTDPRQNTSPGSHLCRFRSRTCRFACTRSRHYMRCHRRQLRGSPLCLGRKCPLCMCCRRLQSARCRLGIGRRRCRVRHRHMDFHCHMEPLRRGACACTLRARNCRACTGCRHHSPPECIRRLGNHLRT